MEEINFGDALVHYNNKLQEIADRVEELTAKVKITQEIAVNWKGMASEAFQDKLLLLNRNLSTCAGNISDAKQLLVGIGTAYEEELASEEKTVQE